MAEQVGAGSTAGASRPAYLVEALRRSACRPRGLASSMKSIRAWLLPARDRRVHVLVRTPVRNRSPACCADRPRGPSALHRRLQVQRARSWSTRQGRADWTTAAAVDQRVARRRGRWRGTGLPWLPASGVVPISRFRSGEAAERGPSQPVEAVLHHRRRRGRSGRRPGCSRGRRRPRLAQQRATFGGTVHAGRERSTSGPRPSTPGRRQSATPRRCWRCRPACGR